MLLMGLLFALFCCACGDNRGLDTETAACTSADSCSKEEAERPLSDNGLDTASTSDSCSREDAEKSHSVEATKGSNSQLATIYRDWSPWTYISQTASSAADYAYSKIYNVTAEVGEVVRKILKEEFWYLITGDMVDTVAAPGNIARIRY